jgi:predicted nucleic acid-binding protein
LTVKFWDSSALVPLVTKEQSSARMQRLLRTDSDVAVWVLSPVELQSALVRKRRAAELDAGELTDARQRMHDLSLGWHAIQSIESVITRAVRLLDVHELRAADVLQLAAALVACDDEPGRLPFVCLDERLSVAAEREGFAVLPT